MSNPYKDLGVEEDATDKEIKTAYRQKAKKHHPDRGGDSESIKQINRAYLILSDPDLRAKYDHGENPDTTPIEVSAAQKLSEIFAQILLKYLGQWNINLIEQCKNELDTEISNVKEIKTNATAIVHKLREVIVRLSCNKGEDKLGMLIEYEIRRIEMEIKQGGERIKVLEYAKDVADYYEFDTDIEHNITITFNV
ncbi:hypothetical protein LCGC14_1143530 [marine sediment metagenome]|uniref:J domain-containing protein n=1 Tax=marine sediment metagenome TaxID=412755 RepID=A0A0F9PFS1_9ZZZZ